jgi:hypothetical protein
MGRLELALIGVLLAAPRAFAQDAPASEDAVPSSPDEAEALRLFNEARAAFEERRYADARRGLERSLELAPRGATAMNLARVLRSLGEVVAAERVLDAIVDGRYGEPTAERRAEAIDLRTEVRREIARISISMRGAETAVVRVDGERIRSLADGASFEHHVDPGRHVVVATAADGRSSEREVAVEPGERARVAIALDTVPVARSGDDDDDGISPWIWVALGGLLVAGGAAVAVVLLVTSADPEPVGDPQGVYPIIEALRF